MDLTAYAGVVLGGSPFTVSEPRDSKSVTERRVEEELTALVRALVEREVPYLGLCYGIGATSLALGGVVDRTYGEPVGATTVRLTEAAADDPLFAGLPSTFTAFVGHKEAATEPPPGAVVVATSDPCPVQAYRVGPCAWVTQFHPELELETFVERIRAYAHLGYFRPDEQDAIIESVSTADVSASARCAEAVRGRVLLSLSGVRRSCQHPDVSALRWCGGGPRDLSGPRRGRARLLRRGPRRP